MAFPRQYLDLRDRQATQEELDQLAPKFQRKCYKAGLTDSWQDCKCIDFPHQSSARPSTCPASCKTCSDQFVPSTSRKNSVVYKVEYHDDRQASSTIDELIRVANTDLAYIRAQIESNGDAIVKTWQGMQQADRVAILRIAMPDLFTNRHADLEVIFEEQRYLTEVLAGRALASEGPTHPENSFFVPFLNKQFLSEDPTRLLALMHHRSHAHLSEWIPSDRERIQKYFHTPVLKNAYNPHCVILRQEKFGRLAQWSRDAAHRWEMCGYPLARQLLRMQCKIADFLKNVVKAILRSSNELPEGRSMWDQVISTSLRSDDDHVTKSAYHSQILAPPPKFDLEQIMSALETQANAALDHAALAQADPIYLRRSLRQIEHSAEYSISTPAEKRRMLFVASVKGMIDCDKWNFLLGRARTLQKSAKKQETIGAQPFQLSREYEDNLLAFESSLIMHFQTLVDELANLVGSNKSFRRYWRKGVQTLQGETAYRQDPLFFALAELGNQSGRNDRPPSWCFSFIDEHLAKASPEERARVDQPLYDHLSDMVVVDEALSGIRAHKSYGPLPPNSPVAEAIYEQIHGKSLSRLIEHLLASCAQDGQIQDTLQSFYKLPLPKKRSNVEMLKYNKTSKQAFTKYWDRVSAKMLSDPVFEDLCSDQKQWVVEKLESYKDGDAYMFETQQSSLANAIRVEDEAVKAEIEKCHINKMAGTENSTGREIAKNADSKPKIKTRPEAPTIDALVNDLAATNVSSTNPPEARSAITIQVKPENIEVFDRMYCSSEQSNKNTDWRRLVAAMADAGCSAISSGGSQVNFKDERNTKGSIGVHKGHPDSSVDHVMLKSIGRRAAKWFGWSRETFVVREKKELR